MTAWDDTPPHFYRHGEYVEVGSARHLELVEEEETAAKVADERRQAVLDAQRYHDATGERGPVVTPVRVCRVYQVGSCSWPTIVIYRPGDAVPWDIAAAAGLVVDQDTPPSPLWTLAP